MRRGGKSITIGQDARLCPVDDRAAAYRHAALLLHGPEQGARNSVMRLAAIVESCRHVPYVDDAGLRRAAAAAADALLTEEGRKAFVEERLALFGGTRYDPFKNAVPSRESTYLGDSETDVAQRVRRLYATSGYRQPRWLSQVQAPDHIAVELDFMGCCLSHATDCGPHYGDIAECFFSEHLLPWAVLFAVATARMARGPVLGYVGLALDKFLACEALAFRSSDSDLCSLHAYAAELAETL